MTATWEQVVTAVLPTISDWAGTDEILARQMLGQPLPLWIKTQVSQEWHNPHSLLPKDSNTKENVELWVKFLKKQLGNTVISFFHRLYLRGKEIHYLRYHVFNRSTVIVMSIAEPWETIKKSLMQDLATGKTQMLKFLRGLFFEFYPVLSDLSLRNQIQWPKIFETPPEDIDLAVKITKRDYTFDLYIYLLTVPKLPSSHKMLELLYLTPESKNPIWLARWNQYKHLFLPHLLSPEQKHYIYTLPREFGGDSNYYFTLDVEDLALAGNIKPLIHQVQQQAHPSSTTLPDVTNHPPALSAQVWRWWQKLWSKQDPTQVRQFIEQVALLLGMGSFGWYLARRMYQTLHQRYQQWRRSGQDVWHLQWKLSHLSQSSDNTHSRRSALIAPRLAQFHRLYHKKYGKVAPDLPQWHQTRGIWQGRIPILPGTSSAEKILYQKQLIQYLHRHHIPAQIIS